MYELHGRLLERLVRSSVEVYLFWLLWRQEALIFVCPPALQAVGTRLWNSV